MNSNIKDALTSFLRVWVITTVGLFVPGLLGWIHEVTEWASQKGAPAFPDPSNLGYLFVAALTAAFPAALAGILRLIENASGRNLLPRPAGPQPPPPVTPPPGEGGYVATSRTWVIVAVVVAVVVILFLAL